MTEKKLLELKKELIKTLSPNWFYSQSTVDKINFIFDKYMYDKRFK